MRDIQKLLNDPLRPKPAPSEFAGQWVAWNHERTKVIAHGSTLAEVHDAAIAAGCANALLQKVRPVDTIFIG